MCDEFIVCGGGGLRRGLSRLDVLAIAVSAVNQVCRKRGVGGGMAFVLGDEVAEADYTSLGHWSVVSKEKREKVGRRDS
jgi:hypothetical protein